MKSLEGEAREKRALVARMLSTAAELDLIAAFRGTGAGIVIELMLERHVEQWEKGGAWGPLDEQSKREQGRALRSKELLEYFTSAEEEAKRLRAEADRLTTLLENAADQGRIPRL